jgi:rhodanese-related sulfurtransferase
MNKTIKTLNKESVPYLTIDEAKQVKEKHMLDAREPKEYKVSHIKDAVFVGYDSFALKTVTDQIKNKQDTVIVYCSIGVRSEDIGEKLLAAGYTNVFNLYGGIFEWKNKENEVYDTEDKETEKVHTYSKFWSRLLKSGISVNE